MHLTEILQLFELSHASYKVGISGIKGPDSQGQIPDGNLGGLETEVNSMNEGSVS